NGECVQCLVDAQCSRPELCGSDHRCHSTCSVNADCTDPQRPFCNVAEKTCVACLVSADCPAAAPICNERKRCVQCLPDRACAAPLPACNDNQCVQCKGDQYCPATAPHCKGHECRAN